MDDVSGAGQLGQSARRAPRRDELTAEFPHSGAAAARRSEPDGGSSR